MGFTRVRKQMFALERILTKTKWKKSILAEVCVKKNSEMPPFLFNQNTLMPLFSISTRNSLYESIIY